MGGELGSWDIRSNKTIEANLGTIYFSSLGGERSITRDVEGRAD